VQVYPMFETAWRAANGWGIDEHRERMGALWARFSKVAASNPNAWIQQEFTAEQIVTPSVDNRMVGFPYTKMLNSNNAVEQSAALLVCSVERARALGVPSERWVFIHAGTDAHDTAHVSNRRDLHSSPAIRTAGRRVFQLAGIDSDDIAHIDIYSCFPSAVEIAAHELGLGSGIGDDRPLTVTGGLSFAGGPWSNYVSHSIATMVDRLRDHPGDLGLCSANGGFLTKHAFGIYSTSPSRAPFRHENPQAEIDAAESVEVAGTAEGPVRIEAYTVMHDRNGAPESGFAAVRLRDGRRAWGRVTDAATMAVMCTDEMVGREAELSAAGELVVD
jgi:acetyl-CoA C-acetyltransferase